MPVIAGNASRAEELRTVPDENVALLHDAGFTRAFQPARFGGAEELPEVYASAVVDIAKGCASTAWAIGLLAQHSHILDALSGRRLDVLEQCVAIGVSGRAGEVLHPDHPSPEIRQ